MEIEKPIFEFMKKQNPNLVFSVELNDVGQVQSMDYENLESAMGFFNRMILNDRDPKSDTEKANKTKGFKTADRFIKSLTPDQIKLFVSVFDLLDSDNKPLFTSLVLSPTKQKWDSKLNKFVNQMAEEFKDLNLKQLNYHGLKDDIQKDLLKLEKK